MKSDLEGWLTSVLPRYSSKPMSSILGAKLTTTLLRRLGIAIVCTAIGLVACGDNNDGNGDNATSACSKLTIDRFKELAIVDEGVLNDPRAKNANNGVWSFRHAIENMMPAGADASEFVMTWLRGGWAELTTLNGYPLDPNLKTDRERREVQERLICPWLKLSESNGCDMTCTNCTQRKLDLSLAPFRLIAITNRMDLRKEVVATPYGEGRLVFAVTRDPGDTAAAKPCSDIFNPNNCTLPMSVIFEYRLPETRTLVEWAKAWHELGGFATQDEPYRAALEQVTNSFTKRGSNPTAINGSAIGQIRTNESALQWLWQLREFGLDATGNLKLQPVRNTPPQSLNNNEVLSKWVNANADAIKAGRFELPTALRAGAADQFMYTWKLPGVDAGLRTAFASSTCNGCHSEEKPQLDRAFHVSPFKLGIEKLSPFMNDPAGRPDDLSHRATLMQDALCGQ